MLALNPSQHLPRHKKCDIMSSENPTHGLFKSFEILQGLKSKRSIIAGIKIIFKFF
jgi:hypothetical protein